jgi:hypothetical protein
LATLTCAHPRLETELVAHPADVLPRVLEITTTLDRPIFGQLVAPKQTDYALDLYGSEAYFKQRADPIL